MGGALLREKIIAFASKRVIFMIDERKWNKPWQECQLPVCIVPFGIAATLKHIQRSGFSGHLRMRGRKPFLTNDGLWIVDLDLNTPIPSLSKIDATLKAIPGVIETGIFYHYATDILVGYSSGKVNHHEVK